jgi:hypothetical protein
MDINLMLACCQNDKLLLSVMPLLAHEPPCSPFKIHNNAAHVTLGVSEDDHNRLAIKPGAKAQIVAG